MAAHVPRPARGSGQEQRQPFCDQLCNLLRPRHARPAWKPSSSTWRRSASASAIDIFLGGLIGTDEIPPVPLAGSAVARLLRTGMPQFLQLVTTTLDNMLLGGLYDHVGGGFFRYTIDERWLVPHFEKMLYDNALLIEFMTSIWQFNRNELCRQRVEETVDWLLRDMKLGDAFAAGLDADTEGEEGKYYLWSEAEIDAALAGTFSAALQAGLWRHPRRQSSWASNILRRMGQIPAATQRSRRSAAGQAARHAAGGARQARAARARRQAARRLERPCHRAPWPMPARCSSAPTGSQAAITAFDYVVKAAGRRRPALSFLGQGGKRGARALPTTMPRWRARRCSLWEVDRRSALPGRRQGLGAHARRPFLGRGDAAAITSPPTTPSR